MELFAFSNYCLGRASHPFFSIRALVLGLLGIFLLQKMSQVENPILLEEIRKDLKDSKEKLDPLD